MIITPEETSMLSGIASLYALRARKEIELAVLRHGVVEDNEVIRGLKVEIGEIDKKLATVPSTGLESFRRYREVMIQQRIVEFLVPMYEQAKIDEVKDLPAVLVLDRAVPPERRASPQRSTIVIVTIFLSFVGLLLIAYLLHGFAFTRIPGGPLGRKMQHAACRVALWYHIDGA